MPGHYNKTRTGADLIGDSLKAAGWTYRPPQGSYAPGMYVNTKTGKSQHTPPLPAGWTMHETPGGRRWVSGTGKVSLTQPMTPEVAPKAASTAAEPKRGTASPRPVVSARGVMSDDTGGRVRSGGQQMLTTPFGITGGAPVKKKRLLGS